jgi:hypothetical protein
MYAFDTLPSMGDYQGFDSHWTWMEVLAAGTRIKLQDWAEDKLTQNAIHVTNGEQGAMIEGPKSALVAMLETALYQARNLPD